MGLNPKTIPDSILSRIQPQDSKADLPRLDITGRITADANIKIERQLQNQIHSWLRLKGITAIRSRMDRKTSNNKGTPDFLFAIGGRAVAIECKMRGLHPTIEQQKMLVALENDGWRVAVIHSLDELRSVLASLA
jgi:hypothetical protein